MASERELFAEVDRLLRDSGGPTAEQIAGDKADRLRQELAEQLKIIGQSAVGEADTGGPKILLPDGSHLRLGGTVWPLLTCTVTFVLAPMDPSGLTYGAAGAALMNAFEKLSKVFNKLDPSERVVCRAVLEVVQKKKAKGNEPESSADELRAHFKEQGEQAPIKLEDNLSNLAKLGVLRQTSYPTTGTYYRVSF